MVSLRIINLMEKDMKKHNSLNTMENSRTGRKMVEEN